MCLERDGGYEKRETKGVIVCWFIYVEDWVLVLRVRKGVTEETCMYVRDSWGCVR